MSIALALALILQVGTPVPSDAADPAGPAGPQIGAAPGTVTGPRAPDAGAPSVGAGPASAADVATLDATLTRVGAMATALVDAGRVPGLSIGIATRGLTRFAGFGRASLPDGPAPGPDTLYEIGSISKVFTGLLLADAVQRGLVRLDDPVNDHLRDGAALAEVDGEPVRLVNLSNHTSGLPRMPRVFDPADPADPYADLDHAALLRAILDAAPRWKPGSRYEYSNLAAGLLGDVLVGTFGKAGYRELLEDEICGPLGLPDTCLDPSPEQTARFARPYDQDLDPGREWHFDALAGAGAVRSTPRDLLRFAAWMLRARQADGADDTDGSVPLADAMRLTQHVTFDFDGDGPGRSGVGLGWHIGENGTTLWHNGQTGAYHAFFAIEPEPADAAFAVVILANGPTGLVDELGNRAIRLLRGEPAEELPATALEPDVPVADAQLERLVGRYALAPAVEIVVTRDARGLSAKLTGQPAFRVHARSDTRFVYRVVEAELEFELDGDAPAKAVILHQGGRDLRAERKDGRAS